MAFDLNAWPKPSCGLERRIAENCAEYASGGAILRRQFPCRMKRRLPQTHCSTLPPCKTIGPLYQNKYSFLKIEQLAGNRAIASNVA
jgi:hypothetical protein